ncbi:NicO domain-containing protein [Rhizoctonia solani AG-1 IA]|uniref:Nickel/cobalt efflux system n=1 Tax=Thanatephorus cucumeris (strain AG1-IA) TaxID=983506 RepID=L8WPI6_THACA|nr:NicO domain-containing protein [Rhizoctonia solani AG-1 IA]
MFTKWPRLTIFGRSFLLVACELLVNALFWVIAGLLFGRRHETHGVLNLCLLAWVRIRFAFGVLSTYIADLGCELDHWLKTWCVIPQFLSCGRPNYPYLQVLMLITSGRAMDCGHCHIDGCIRSYWRYDHIKKMNNVVLIGLQGAAVSASFLFIVALVNSIILARILKQRKRRLNGEDVGPENSHSLALRILGPVTKFVNRSWKMYPVGVLFGLGFDTASSIALIAVTALAQRGADGAEMPRSHIVILPLLFTAGMTLVDSADSVLMLYSYADFPEKGFALFENQETSVSEHSSISSHSSTEAQPGPSTGVGTSTLPPSPKQSITSRPVLPDLERNSSADRRLQEGLGDDEYKITLTEQKTLDQAAKNTMSGLSIILTLLSILVAFSISLITIMGLIGENCDSCREAAEDPNGGGLAGSWWRGWARVSSVLYANVESS